MAGQDPTGTAEEVVTEAVELAKRYVTRCAESYKDMYDKAAGGGYGAADAVDDLTRMWREMLDYGGQVAELGARALRLVTGSGASQGGAQDG